jgi:hypothetical protein
MEMASDLIAKNAPTRPENLTTEQKLSESASKLDAEQSYWDELYLIINSSFTLSSQRPTDEEKVVCCKAWTDVLMGVIPEADLTRSYKRAFRDHASNYAVNAYDLKVAYDKLVEEERAAKRAEDDRFMAVAEQRERNGVHRFECEHCFNSGFREIDDPKGGPNRGVVGCDRCYY